MLSLAVSFGCRKAPQRTSEVVAISVAQIPAEPLDAVWEHAPEHVARLLPQDLVEPRLLKPSTSEVRVRAVATKSELAFRLQWLDALANDISGPDNFVDACAIQLPRQIAPNPPDVQMGQAGQPVEITFWRADWQASANGRSDSLKILYPNASVDHYPFEAPSLQPGSAAQREMASRYAPAQALGNRRVGPRDVPVEDLVAEGPGTLAPDSSGASKAKGVRATDGWLVVVSRRRPAGLATRQRTQVAFAVWEGSGHETGSRKMRTGWIPLLVREER
jgi:hypothetical protein